LYKKCTLKCVCASARSRSNTTLSAHYYYFILRSRRGIKCTALISSSAAAAINLWRTPPAASFMGDLAHRGANICFYLHANSCWGAWRSRLLTSSANECFATKLLFCIITYLLLLMQMHSLISAFHRKTDKLPLTEQRARSKLCTTAICILPPIHNYIQCNNTQLCHY
jgi:hypothetical protein